MSEIEKMYKLANVQPYYKKRIECKEGYSIGQPCGKSPCIDCDKSVFEDIMPPFTAEKQLKIMELLVRKGMLLFTFSTKGNYKVSGFYGGSNYYSDINEAFANYINILWQDLTEEEGKQIKEILE